jgi:hypothetical protein
MDPINYSAALAPPASPTAPLDALQQEQGLSAQRQLAANQIHMQLQQQALSQAALHDALSNPSPQTYRNLMLVNPQASQAIKGAYDSLDEQTQRQSLQDITAFHNLLDANRPDDAVAVLQNHIDAAHRAGQDTTAYESLKNLAQTQPRQAQVMAGMMLSTIGGADKMASAYSTMGQEGRAQASFPLDVQEKQADIALKTAQASAAGTDTEVNPVTGAYYNKKAPPPPAAALTSNNGALDNVVGQIVASEKGATPDAKNPNSTAQGDGQFLKATWSQLLAQTHPELVQGKTPQQILDLRNNPQLAAEMTAAYAQQNAQTLGQAGLPVNGATIAMAHRLGAQGAQAVLGAQANAPLSQVLSADVIKANPQYAKMTAGQLGTQLARQFGTTNIDTNPGDPNASGDDFLRTLAPPRAALVKAIAEGLQPGPTGRSAASGPGAFLMQQVQQYDPTASSINLQTRQATRKAFTSGTQGQSIIQANTVGGHLAALDALADTLNNGPFPLVNAVANPAQVNLHIGDKQKTVTAFNTLSNTLASELTKFYRNNGGSEADVKEFRSQLSSSSSPDQIHTAIKEMAGAVLSKIGALNDSYSAGMGKVSDGLNLPNINHNAIAQLQRLAGDSSLGGGGSQQTASAPQVYVNPKTGQRIVSDGAGGWKTL